MHKHLNGCRVIIQTNYTDEVEEDFRVVHQKGSHNHHLTRDSLQQTLRLCTLNSNTRKTWKTYHVDYPSGGVRESVVKKEDVNTCKKDQPNFTPIYDQDAYPGEEQEEDLESVD